MNSTRPDLPKDLLRINEATSGNIGTRLPERLMECGPPAFVEPIARVEWQELQFGAFRQVGWLIDHEASLANTSFDGHKN